MRGSIHKRTLKDGKTVRYDCSWRDASGKQYRKTFTRKKDAENFLNEASKDVHDGAFVRVTPTPMKTVFTEWLEQLETRQKSGELKASTAATYTCNVKVHLKPAFGDYRSDKLAARAVSRWRAECAEKIASGAMSAKSFNNLLNLLASILSWARHPAQGYMRHDPLIGQKRLKVKRQEAEFLEEDDIARLLGAVVGDVEADAIVQLGLFAGMRRGEVFGLQWGDINWNDGQPGGRVHVRRSVYQTNVQTPKTEQSERAIDVPRRVLEALAALRTERDEPTAGDFVFCTRTGAAVDPNSWYRRNWLAIRKRAELADGVGLHSLRHTYASLLIRQGENPKYVSTQLGHTSTSFTMDRYGHLFRSTGEEAMQRLEALAPEPKTPDLHVVNA